jgi:hypothetical protein
MMLVAKVRSLENLTPIVSVVVVGKSGIFSSEIPMLDEGKV